jgi:HNH endonuclease
MSIPDEVILRVHRRNKFTCVYCGYQGCNRDAFRLLTIDHIVPKLKDGTDKEENLVTVCRPCNHYKGRNHFLSVPHAKLWLRLYKEICTDAWYQAHVIAGKDPKTWHPREKLKKVNQLFKEQGGKLITENVGRDTHAT